MKTIDILLLAYAALYVAVFTLVGVFAFDQGCLFNCAGGSFENENPYHNPITWIVLIVLFWPVPVMMKRVIGFASRFFCR